MAGGWNKWRVAVVCLLLSSVTLIVYWSVTRHGFINYDDPVYITENPYITHGLTWKGLTWAFTKVHGESTYWHPLTWVSHMLDCELFGLKAGAHHLINVFFHVANTVLLFLVLRKMTGAFWRSAMVSALFAWHPLQVDTVAWVTERKNVLSTLFWMLTLLAYVRYVEQSKVQGSRSKVFYALALLLFGMGLMCKPVLVTLPCVLLLLDFWPLQRTDFTKPKLCVATLAPLFLEKLPFFVLSAASSAITMIAHEGLGMMKPIYSPPLDLRIENAVVSYVRYLGKAFWPTKLAVCYPHPGMWPFEKVFSSFLVLLMVSGLVIWGIRRRPYLLVGWLWFLGVLVPAIGLVQAGVQSMADRFAYVPIIGLFIFVVWGISDLASQARLLRSIVPLAAVAALCGCFFCTSVQLRYWKDSVTLFSHALDVTENNFVAHNNLGAALSTQGKPKEAIAHYLEALRLDSHDSLLHNNLSVALAADGKTDEALEHCSEALQIDPNDTDALNNMGVLLSQQGKLAEARPYFEAALRIRPQFAEAHAKLGIALAALGRVDEAMSSYREALRLKPDLVAAMNNLAWLLATHPDPKFRDGPEAVRLAERACQLTRYKTPFLIGTLAAAYAEAGRFDDAVVAGQKARDLALETGQKVLAQRNTELIELYRAKHPLREDPSVSSVKTDIAPASKGTD